MSKFLLGVIVTLLVLILGGLGFALLGIWLVVKGALRLSAY